MKSVYLCLAVCAAISVSGCSGKKESSLADEGVTADAIAQYEAELAAVSGDDAYDDAEGDDAGAGDAAGGDAE